MVLLGAALGAFNPGVVVALEWTLRRRGDVGWYSCAPMPRQYPDCLLAQHIVNGWAAVAVVAGVLIAGNTLIFAAYLVVIRRRLNA